MNKHYFSLWALLLCAFAVFAASSAVEMPEICGYQPKSSEIVSVLTAPRTTRSATKTTPAQAVKKSSKTATKPISTPSREAALAPCDSSSQVILFIGDSMLEGLSPRLAAYAKKNGHKLYSVIWYSSTSEIWGKSRKLSRYIQRTHPTHIFICLGANELLVSNIATKRDRFVKQILSEIGNIPYTWIGPPNWREDTGINNLIATNTKPGTFFLSNGMKFNRAKDGAHPTHDSAREWMDSVVRWMPLNSSHPFRLDVPTELSARPDKIYVHQPNER